MSAKAAKSKSANRRPKHKVVSRKEWTAARLKLLKAEKELTRRSDELAQRRQELPWVRIDKEYRFETDEGGASLSDLFRGRSQLLVYHFMFGPDYTAGCPSCSAIADGYNGVAVHLANHDVMFWTISRAPLAKLRAYKQRMSWTFPWASSFGSDFNFDFSVGLTKEQQRKGAVEYNYEREEPWNPEESDGVVAFAKMSGTDAATYVRETGHGRVRAGRRRCLSHLLRLCARSGRVVGNVSMARPSAEGTQRDRPLVAPTRRILKGQQEKDRHL